MFQMRGLAMLARLEHANLTVPDIDAAIDFLVTLEPRFRVRHDSGTSGEYRWAHIGTDESYIALEEPHRPNPEAQLSTRYSDFGINHLGWVVESIDDVCARLEAKGFREGFQSEDHIFRKRRYYLDSAGFEWELVEYFTENTEEQTSYV